MRIERAFYVGQFTELDLQLPALGDPLREVSVCEVRGCGDGTAFTCELDFDPPRHYCAR